MRCMQTQRLIPGMLASVHLMAFLCSPITCRSFFSCSPITSAHLFIHFPSRHYFPFWCSCFCFISIQSSSSSCFNFMFFIFPQTSSSSPYLVVSFWLLEVNLHTYLTTWLSSCPVGIFSRSHTIIVKIQNHKQSVTIKWTTLKSTHIR